MLVGFGLTAPSTARSMAKPARLNERAGFADYSGIFRSRRTNAATSVGGPPALLAVGELGQPLQPAPEVPVLLPQQRPHRGQQHRSHDRGVQQDRDRQPEQHNNDNKRPPALDRADA